MFPSWVPLHFFSLQDGSRSGSGREERRLQPAVRHLGRGHHLHRVGGAAAAHVRPAPHAVHSTSSATLIRHRSIS